MIAFYNGAAFIDYTLLDVDKRGLDAQTAERQVSSGCPDSPALHR
jgi:hypothetical protein